MSTSVDWVFLRLRNGEEISVSKSKLFSKSNLMYSRISKAPLNYEVLILNDVRGNNGRQLVEFIENDDPLLGSVENAIDIYSISKIYEIPDLKKFCLKFLIQNIGVENFFTVHNFACREHERLIQYYCWIFLDKNWKDVFAVEMMQRCTSETIITLLSRPKYETIPEVELFLAVFRWNLSNFCINTELDPALVMEDSDIRECLRQAMIPYFRMIRFHKMEEKDLETWVFPLNLLTSEEINAIQSHIQGRNEVNLPETICRSTVDRLQVNSLTLFHYQCRRNLDYKKNLLFDSENSFMCEIKVDYNCFLTSLKLPIKHTNLKNITVKFEGYTVSEDNSFSIPLLDCDRNGNIPMPEPIFLEENSMSRIWIKILEREVNAHNHITIDANRDDFISDEEFEKYYSMKPMSKRKKWNKLYCDVTLYF